MRNFPVYKKIKTLKKVFIFWRRHPDSNRGIRVLQTRALPLGYVAEYLRYDIIYSLLIKIVPNNNKKVNSEQLKIWSGKRGSNPRPLPWQGSALSTELFPQKLKHNYDSKFI